MYCYSDSAREQDPWALPDVEIFQLTAEEVAVMDEEMMQEYKKRHEFRLAGVNRTVRDTMIDTIIEEQGITGGWFYWYCFPGCLPDSDPIGPFASKQEAQQAIEEEVSEWIDSTLQQFKEGGER